MITVDGPSGSGKGTLAGLIAKFLKWHYLESGALYRILAYAALQSNVEFDDIAGLAELAKTLQVKFETHEFDKIYWSHHDITDEIHTERYGNLASKIAAIPEVREALLERQQAFRLMPGLVTDGRDMGTVVFPDAELKFFITAERDERAKRRHIQLKQKGINVSLESVLDELSERDHRDQHRMVSPLKPAEDAILIDTTSLTIAQTYDQMMKIIQEAFGTSVIETDGKSSGQ